MLAQSIYQSIYRYRFQDIVIRSNRERSFGLFALIYNRQHKDFYALKPGIIPDFFYKTDPIQIRHTPINDYQINGGVEFKFDQL